MSSTPNKRSSWLPVILAGLAFIGITGALIWAIEAIGLERIREVIESAGPLAPLAFIAIKITTYVFAPLNSGPIQFSAGILFGLLPGTLYVLIGEVIGGSISFWIARTLGRTVVRRFVGEAGMARVDQFYHQVGGWRGLLYARLFLFSIYDFISYAAGFTPVRQDAWEELRANPVWSRMLDAAVTYGRAFSDIRASAELRPLLVEQVSMYLSDQQSLEDTQQFLKEEYDAILEDNGYL